MMHKHTTGQRKVSPPGPSFMSSDQVSTYLKDLRSNRPVRPTGSRPYPGRAAASTSDIPDSLPPRASSALSMHTPVEDEIEVHPRSGSAMSHRRANSHVPSGGAMGRPLVQEPRTHSIRKNVFPAQIHARTIPIPVSPSLSYRENGQRRHEKEEARALRDALQKMDIQDDVGLHQAAQDEATELVWMHQNPGKAFKNPYAPYKNPDSDRRSQSPVLDIPREYNPSTNRFSQSTGSSVSSDVNSSPESARKRSSLAGPSKKNLKVNFKLPDEEPEQPLAPKSRSASSDSSKGIFRNPNDQIYEEPVDTQKEPEAKPDFSKSDSSALKNKPRNALGRVPRPLPWLQNRAHSSPLMDKISRFEINKNPPPQPRNAGYTRNESATPPSTQSHNAGYTRNELVTPTPPPEQKRELTPTQDGRERRSDDIRAATSKKRGDRSEKLPMPTAVSDRVGRPIVSFDRTWKPSDQPKPDRPTLPVIEIAPPTIEVSAPSIEVSEPPPIPVINIPDIKVPTISEIEAPSKQQTRPVPQSTRSCPTKPGFPKQQGSDSKSRWYSPYIRSGVPTARCELCTLSISGKIVTAGGCRFHPECFTCFHCHTALECVAFYQEPESSRAERLATEANDHEACVPRFYCHLDFHEMFSPRCKSCKTPIEGEVVVACGAEWHVGHFFCAECGDPFDSQTPFVEKDGFAWCLHCHSRRTAPRCLGCKQHVMDDVVISAIGGQWHERCFNCHECGDGFGPEGRFFVREGEPKRTAKGRIIGGPVQLAICERCEGIRLKAPGMC
ncbi:uncharacterized protein N7479_002121 [Penicillium vulpinum]|uniref:LIM zinc-binding domain-containing protein n=1 Tax=Penicillium vulpinum TaxID=29845 RepID=A0A1V6S6W1_9EURO|nr:uncharacterized protein N7479_002121 [Penicillium vulpinum]KAJ5972203.1 hypothetical protein N7479_002121 [Penicillium vulpinum]OQE09787.1 hypothetical protein PENVUL_c005G02243 [Penicillium vulpinum]